MSPTPSFHLLVIDDDPLIIDSLRLVLPKNWHMTSSHNGQYLDAKIIFHAAFVDMHLSKDTSTAEGPLLIEKIHKNNPKIQIVAMSGDLSMELMESCLEKGASKFLAKPLAPDEIISNLEKIEALWEMRFVENQSRFSQVQWIGNSLASESIKKAVALLRGEAGPILIEGETGTGKEVVTKLLNQQEGHRHLISVNIASLAENLFESEFFGHVKGAFTGADTLKIGLAEAALGGDLFLDEIEALSLNNQVKLLRFLETGEIRKVGAKESSHIQCRVIVASNQNLNILVKESKFREDLYFRLSGKKINLPPLRQRLEDIPALANFFLSLHRPRKNKHFSNEAIVQLQKHMWPGNVRELKRICEQAALISPLPIIRDLDIIHLLQPSDVLSAEQALDFNLGLSKLLENYEAFVLNQIFKRESDIDSVAQTLQISRSSLYKKIKDYQIEVKS